MNDEMTAQQRGKLNTYTMVAIALITAVTCILGPISIPIPISPVPISITNFVLLISIYVLGFRYATISLVLYLLLGLAGLPVFSGFAGGIGKFAGPTGGYLIGFLFLVPVAGFFIDRFPKKPVVHIVGMVLAFAVTNIFGTLWLGRQMNMPFTAALGVGVLPYLPGDIIKIILAVIIGPTLRKRLSQWRFRKG